MQPVTDLGAGCTALGHHRRSCAAGCARVPASQISPPPVGVLISAGRVVSALAVLAVAVPVVILASAVPGYGRQRRATIALGWACRKLLAALGFTVRVTGTPRAEASLVVANHTSWLDILVLAAAAPSVPVAKREIADWPVVGPLARRCGAIPVDRDAWSALPDTVAKMTDALRRGLRVQVFPEATTRCGLAIGEFHRASFQAALDAAVVVQPAALRYQAAGRQTTATSFVGDETLVASLVRVLRLRRPVVELRWAAAIPAIAGTGRPYRDRAVLAALTQHAISRALDQPVLRRRSTRVRRPERTRVPA